MSKTKFNRGDLTDIPERENYDDYDDMEYDVDDSDPDDDDDDEFERAMDECGEIPGVGCTLVGTEYCDWECPFSKAMHNNLNRKRDEKGRYCK